MLEKIIAGCRQQDAQQQRELFRRYAPAMMTVARRYTQNREEAEEVVQDAFVRVFRFFHQFKGDRGSLEGWMRRIVINTAIQYWRKWHKHFLVVCEDHAPVESVLMEKDMQLDAEQILALIEKLPPGFRIVFNLYAIEGYSHAEIAEQLGIAESASRSQLFRARKHLQDALHKLYQINLT